MSGSSVLSAAAGVAGLVPGVGTAIGLALGVADKLGLGDWITKHILGDSTGGVAAQVVSVVKAVTGGATDAAALASIPADQRATIQVRLAEIAAAREVEEHRAAEAERTADLDRIKQALADTANARGSMVALAQAGSRIAWAPVVVTASVLLTFAGLSALLMAHEVPASSQQLMTIMLGALTGMAASSVSYWVGSSASSAQKTDALAQSVPVSAINAMRGGAAGTAPFVR